MISCFSSIRFEISGAQFEKSAPQEIDAVGKGE